MRYLAIAAGVLLLGAGASRAAPQPPISPAQARGHEGECFSVEGQAEIHDDPLRPGMDIELANGANHFIGFIPVEDEAQFPALRRYQGRLVDVTGVIQFYLGEPEIKMMNAHQLLTAADFHNRETLLGC